MILANVYCSSLMQEGEFHRLADFTIQGLQEKLEVNLYHGSWFNIISQIHNLELLLRFCELYFIAFQEYGDNLQIDGFDVDYGVRMPK